VKSNRGLRASGAIYRASRSPDGARSWRCSDHGGLNHEPRARRPAWALWARPEAEHVGRARTSMAASSADDHLTVDGDANVNVNVVVVNFKHEYHVSLGLVIAARIHKAPQSRPHPTPPSRTYPAPPSRPCPTPPSSQPSVVGHPPPCTSSMAHAHPRRSMHILDAYPRCTPSMHVPSMALLARDHHVAIPQGAPLTVRGTA